MKKIKQIDKEPFVCTNDASRSDIYEIREKLRELIRAVNQLLEESKEEK